MFKDESGATKERSTSLSFSKENYKAALKLAARLELELEGSRPPNILFKKRHNLGKVISPDTDSSSSLDGSWDVFREYFNETHLAGLSRSYRKTMSPVLKRFEDFAKIEYIQQISPTLIRRWIAFLRDQGLAEASIRTYWRHLSAFLGIAVDEGLLKAVPSIRLPKQKKGNLAKGRPITTEEFDRMRAAVRKERDVKVEQWEFLLDGLWLSGIADRGSVSTYLE